MPTQIQLEDLKEDPTKLGEVIIRDESTGELVSEPHLDKKRGGFGEDISSKSGFPKLIDGEWSFEAGVGGSSSWGDIIGDIGEQSDLVAEFAKKMDVEPIVLPVGTDMDTVVDTGVYVDNDNGYMIRVSIINSNIIQTITYDDGTTGYRYKTGAIWGDWLQFANIAELSYKVDKVTGKGLSTNDYTATDKAIVDKVAVIPVNPERMYLNGNKEYTEVGSTAFDDLLLDNPSGHVIVANGTPYVEPLEAIREWTPETQYTSGMVFSYKKLLFRYMNATTSSANFSDDLGLIECLSSNAKIIYQLNHGFLPLTPLYLEKGVTNSTVVSFTTVGTTSWTPPENTVSVDVLIIGGGGGGGRYYTNAEGVQGGSANGGGAGTQRYYTNVPLPFPYVPISIKVGAGGTGCTKYVDGQTVKGNLATNGGSSSFGTLTATGGTAGGGTTGNTDKGGSNADYSGCGVSGADWGGGAGSGASATNKNGGAGKYCAITGTNIIRGGGGSGAEPYTDGSGDSSGGAGGGGVGSLVIGGVRYPATSGANGTGSGGGGGAVGGTFYSGGGNGGNGGSGIVIVKYTVSNDIWKLAKANTQETKATHVVIEKSTNFALISNQGTFDFGGHGLTDGVKYVSDTTLGGYSDYDNQMLSNPFLFVSGSDITIMSGLIIRNTDRYIDNFINGYSTAPIGSVIPYAGIIVPDAYLFCDGSEVSKTVYAELYSVIGDRYGSPSLSTNFKLPNLLGRVIGGLDSTQTEFDTVGKSGGAKTHTLTTAEIPAHTHNVSTRNSVTSGGSEVARVQTAGTVSPIATATNTGGGGAHNNLQPYLTMNYIIKYRKDELGDNGGTGVNTGDETKATIEAKLTGQIDSHTHFGLGQNEESFVLIKRIDKSTAGDEVVTLDGNLYDVIKIYVQSSNASTTAGNLYFKFNNDGGSNYSRQIMYATSSSVAALLTASGTSILLNYNYGFVGATSISELTIYPKVTGNRRPLTIIRNLMDLITRPYTQTEAHHWLNTADNITTINITGFTAGSQHTITILGRKAPV